MRGLHRWRGALGLPAALLLAAACGGTLPTAVPTPGATPPPSNAAPFVPSPSATAAATVTPAPSSTPAPSVAPTDASGDGLTATPQACPSGSTSPTHLVADDGTTYDLLADPASDQRACWLVASNVHGVPGTGWRVRLETALVQVARGENGVLYVLLAHRTYNVTDGPSPRHLLVIGPDGIRADVATAWDLEAAPWGTVYLLSQETDPETAPPDTLAALGPDGLPAPGWPYRVTGGIGRPAFGPGETAYLVQSTSAGDAVVALGPDGAMRAGWPYLIPGSGLGLLMGLRAPAIGADGSAYDAFADGIYWVGADGRPKPGWPYLMPADVRPANQEHFGLDAPPFRPIQATEGVFCLPVTDESTAVAHNEVLCLDARAQPRPGWPVRLPDGWVIGEFSFDEWAVAQLSLGRDVHGNVQWRSVSIRPDGAQSTRVVAGDTISQLAEAYGISQSALLAANPHVTDASLIHPGDTLVIPAVAH